MTIADRHPVGWSAAGAAALMGILIVLALTLPLGENAEHAGGHLAIGTPLLLLLVWAILRWPPPGPEFASRLARGALLTGFGVASAGLVIEAVGAFGYADGFGATNSLSLHDVGVALWPVGFVAMMVGATMSVGVALAKRCGAVGSRVLNWAMVVALMGVAAFVLGALVFGY